MSLRVKILCDTTGLSKEVLVNSKMFDYCPGCADLYTLESPPDLLTCGHLICEQCIYECKNCPCCGNNLKIKDKRYTKLI